MPVSSSGNLYFNEAQCRVDIPPDSIFKKAVYICDKCLFQDLKIVPHYNNLNFLTCKTPEQPPRTLFNHTMPKLSNHLTAS